MQQIAKFLVASKLWNDDLNSLVTLHAGNVSFFPFQTENKNTSTIITV